LNHEKNEENISYYRLSRIEIKFDFEEEEGSEIL
jgi:hypothetical protein